MRRLLMAVWLALTAMLGGAVTAADSQNPQVEQQQVQPLNNAPVWRAVRYGEPGVTQVRGVDSNVLIQASGETWRQIRNGPITLYGGVLLILVPIGILGFYRLAGPIKTHDAPTGRKLERFSRWERIVHWTTAITFVILALTGILLLFGKHLLIPLIGYEAFSWVGAASKNLHNFVGPLFIFAVACMFFTYLRENLWKAHDLEWLRKMTKVLTGKAHVPSGKYNAAEKGWFWGGVAFLGLVVGASGLVLDFANFGQGRVVMQVANVVHGVGALLFVLASFGHIYMGTIGTEGAFDAMMSGQVDETWAREHHELWYREATSRASPAASTGGAPRPAG